MEFGCKEVINIKLIWKRRIDITTGSILTNKQRPLTMSELEQKIKETKDELTKIIRNNENMKKIIAEKKNATKDLEQIVKSVIFRY